MRKMIAMNGHYNFYCPGCDEVHSPDTGWTFTGTFESPTLSPSVLVRSGHFVDGNKDACWCADDAKRLADGVSVSGFKCGQCHSFVQGGQIKFLPDSTHALSGRSVDLPEILIRDGEIVKAGK